MGRIAAAGTRLVLAVIVGSLIAACGGEGSGGGNAKLKVVTTVAPIADLTSRVAGDRASVTSLIPRGENGHTYQPRPSDARALVGADAFIDNGVGLNEAIDDFADEHLSNTVERLMLGEALPQTELITTEAGICHFGHCHDSSVNPHLWPDPVFAAQYVTSIGTFLGDLDPAGREEYDKNAEGLRNEILGLHRATQQAVETIPDANRKLVVYHDAWAYFARRYGLEMGTVIQPVNFAEPSAAEVAGIIDELKTERVPAFFGSEVFPSDVLETIGRESGKRYVPNLSDDRLPGKEGQPINSYVGLMASNARLIVSNLGGDPSALDRVTPR